MVDVHGISKPFVCRQCPEGAQKRYGSEKGYQFHVQTVHLKVEKKYQCIYCAKWFHRKQNWEKHQRVHDGKKPYKCDHCGKRFGVRSSLKVHVDNVHLRMKSHQCSYCGKMFATSNGMKSHAVHRHNAEEFANWKCTLCPKQFYVKSRYLDHVKAHKGEKVNKYDNHSYKFFLIG